MTERSSFKLLLEVACDMLIEILNRYYNTMFVTIHTVRKKRIASRALLRWWWRGRGRQDLVSSGRVSNASECESMIWSKLPPGKSVRPMLPANSVSPAMSSLSGAKCRQMEPWVWPGV